MNKIRKNHVIYLLYILLKLCLSQTLVLEYQINSKSYNN